MGYLEVSKNKNQVANNKTMTTAAFDPYAWHDHYHGSVSREEADAILNEDGLDFGTFLIRDSSTQVGDYVLSVKERLRVSHYLIQSTETDDGGNRMTIGERSFVDVAELLNFFKMYYLDTSSLTRPAPRKVLCKVAAKFDFEGQESTDLSFRRGEVLQVLAKDEMWWTARNDVGRAGVIPANYVQPVEENGNYFGGNWTADTAAGSSTGSARNSAHSSEGAVSNRNSSTSPVVAAGENDSRNSYGSQRQSTTSQRKLPALARVIQNRLPNAYDKTALRLRIGDLLMVSRCEPNGQWTGTLQSTQKTGVFPFNYVEWIDRDDALSPASNP